MPRLQFGHAVSSVGNEFIRQLEGESTLFLQFGHAVSSVGNIHDGDHHLVSGALQFGHAVSSVGNWTGPSSRN